MMRYAKPEVVLVEGAVATILGTQKAASPNSDQAPPNFQTISAYEADE